MVSAPPPADERSYYSISQAAALLGVSRMSIWRWIRAGRLPVARLGHRTTRIRREDLERLLSERGSATSRMRDVGDGGPGRDNADAPLSAWQAIAPSSHAVQFYEADVVLLDALTGYIGAGLRAGEAVIVLATATHRAGLEERLVAEGLDLDAARARGDYLAVDAAEMLALFMTDGGPDAERFAEVIGALLRHAAGGGRPVRAFGEMVALLAAEGNHDAALRLEALWNGLQRVHTFSLFCAYPMDALGGDDFAAVFDDVCAEHSDVIPAESYAQLADSDARLRAIAALQQKAASLEAEVAARKQAELAVRRLAAIVESSDDAILSKTLDGIIVDWNRGAERIYGYSVDEVLGRPVSLLIPDDQPDEFPAIMDRLRRGERIDHYETVRVRKDGRRLEISVTISPIRDGSGRIVGASAVARDITDRKLAEREREELLARERQARAEAEAALRLRNEFLSIASHELRTPLTTLKGFAQVALRRLERAGQLEPEWTAETLRTIASQSDKLSRLLSQLLDISRVESGKLALERQPTDLVTLVEQVVSGARARDIGHVITLATPASLDAEVDPLRLEQVLTNLLDNAIKYSPDGGPIEVSVSQGGEQMVEIAVRDHGLGIPPEKRARIFERFFQAHGDGHRSGLGLGLYISYQIVELHGGKLRAEFPPDGGSCFIVRLPLTHEVARSVRS